VLSNEAVAVTPAASFASCIIIFAVHTPVPSPPSISSAAIAAKCFVYEAVLVVTSPNATLIPPLLGSGTNFITTYILI